MTSLTNSKETVMTILQYRSPSLTGFVSSRGVGGVQSRVKIKTKCKLENRAFWLPLNHRLANRY